jgi:hypothetical protein
MLETPGRAVRVARSESAFKIEIEGHMAQIGEMSVVALLEDLPEHGLVRGQVGTVVLAWAPGIYEVEFSDAEGKPYALVAVREEQLIRLRQEPESRQAA